MTAKPFDPTLKALVETDPASWPILLGQPPGPTTVIDADIATVSGAADKVLHVRAATPYLLHLEFVAGHDAAALPRRLLSRNSLLDDRHEMPVRTAAILLRPEADSPQLTGLYTRRFPGEEPYISFRYSVLRVWQLSPDLLLKGSHALYPLATISAVTEAELPGIIKSIEQRLSRRRERKYAEKVWAAYILSGLRFTEELSEQLFQGVVSMEESTTYQAILKKGRGEGFVIEARKLLRVRGDEEYGPPNNRMAAAIEAINDLHQLEELFGRMSSASNWEELLGGGATGRKGTRRRKST